MKIQKNEDSELSTTDQIKSDSPMTEIPLSGSKRSAVVLKTAFRAGVQRSKFLLAHRFSDVDDSTETAHQKALADIVYKGLCQLRGTAIKFAQVISSETSLLRPEQMAVLQESQYRVPPLNSVIVGKVFRREFGKDPHEIFAEFEPKAFAAASLGQVHRARLKDGTLVAVKIQYPGIDQTISVDIGLMRKLVGTLPRSGLMSHTLDSVEDRLLEEVDYTIELAHAQKFAANVKAHERSNGSSSGIAGGGTNGRTLGPLIPKVYPEFSSRRIITYEFIEGRHLQEWLQLGVNEDQRSQIGQQLWDLFFDSLRSGDLIHADPNWGNFLILENQRLALLDFGCMQKLSPEAAQLFRKLCAPSTEVSPTELVSLYGQMGAEPSKLDPDPQVFYERVIAPYKGWLEALTTVDKITFSNQLKLAQQGQRLLFKEAFQSSMQNFSSQFTMIHRTFFGLVQILSVLNATVLNSYSQGEYKSDS